MMTVKKVLGFGMVAIIATSGWSCQSQSKANENENSTSCLMEEMAGRLAFKVAEAASFNEELVLSGHVTFNQDKVVPFVPLVSGNVLQVNFELGDKVTRGQVLATIRSAELDEIRKELAAARSEYRVAKNQLEMQKGLHEGGISSQRDLMIAENEYQMAQAEIERLTSLLELYGGDNSGIQQLVRAPASGYIVQKNMNPGMQLEAGGEPAFTISDLEDVWVIANVYQSDLPRIRQGQPVKIESHAFPGKQFEGIINNIANVLDPEEKVLKVRVQLKNDEKLLKPGIFARVVVENETGEMFPVVPASALIFDRNRHFLMLSGDGCIPETREVQIFSTQNGRAFIREGITDGEKLVSKNQLLLYNALNY